MSHFKAPEHREIVREVQIGEQEWVVMGKEPFRPERFSYCTWLGNKCGLERGHYSMSLQEAEEDMMDRIRRGN